MAALAAAAPATAQPLPDEPFSWWNGRLLASGDASIAVSQSDPGWFNDTDYGENVLRLATGGIALSARLARQLEVLSEIRVENSVRPRVLSLFGRVRPWTDRPIDVQVGIIPPVFGTFARRRYGADNPLIGSPLAYQYLTTLRDDATPLTPDALLAVRGEGWYLAYPSGIGDRAPRQGLPLVSALEWDAGVQARVGSRPLEVAVSLTTGSLSHGAIRDGNGGRQLAARLAVTPTPLVTLGASVSTGAYLSNAVVAGTPADGQHFAQQAVGLDAELSRSHWLVRAEFIASRWELPRQAAPALPGRLGARALSTEGRYRLRPDAYLAARAEHLSFSTIRPAAGPGLPWDAPVTRVEAGGGFYLLRNAVLKLAYQHNWRARVPVRQAQGQLAAQLAYWF